MTNIALTQNEQLDRSKPPKPGTPKDINFPVYFDTVLPNGINVLVIENHKIPVVSVRMVFKESGSYFDGSKYGLASLTAELLTKGTTTRTATQIAEEIDFLGASLSSGSDWDGTFVSLSALAKHLDTAIAVLADVVENPVFDDAEINRVKDQRITGIIQAKDDPASLSDKMFNKVLFAGVPGESEPYAYPSEGTEESIKDLTKPDIQGFYDTHYSSDKLILAFVGSINKEEALRLVKKYFSNLKSNDHKQNEEQNTKPEKDYSTKDVYIVDKPGAVQSNIKIGHIGLNRNNPDYIAVTVMNTILGGYFGSRINYNLREVHGYTYGARSGFTPHIYPGDFSVDADVRNEVTDSSVALVFDELKRIVAEVVTDDELQKVKNYLTGVFPLQLETANAVATRAINLKLYNLPKNYYDTYISKILSLTTDDIQKAAKEYIHPGICYIVISGNAKVIKDKMQKFGNVRVFDADGKEIQ